MRGQVMMRSNLFAPIRPRRIKVGLIVYLAVTYSLSWGSAFAVKGMLGDLKAPIIFSLFVSSLGYLISTGWQPLLAVWLVRRFVDPEYDSEGRFRSVNDAIWTAALVLPFALILLAMVLTFLTPSLFSATGSRADRLAPGVTPDSALSASMLVWTAMVVVWMQTVAEEVGWRGYFLVKLMQLNGPRAGLALHGVVWGLWYAPLVLVGAGASSESALAGLGFVVTCCLL